MVQAVDGAFGLAQDLSDLRRGEAEDVAEDQHFALSTGSCASALRRSRPRWWAICPLTSSRTPTSRQGTLRRVRRWSRVALRATLRIQAAKGASRGSYLPITLISLMKTSWVMSSAWWRSLTKLSTYRRTSSA
jgi:hypothetical protein